MVSAGHSGATVACGMFIMGRLPGVERPALAALLPTEKNPVVVLDAGANVDCRPYHLFQFGLMGDAFARDLLGCHGRALCGVSLLRASAKRKARATARLKEAYELPAILPRISTSCNKPKRDILRAISMS